uniref:Uncharacterized protein n=1 Tax=Triticum urartu TaxID=4572 RepID=A0A8R7VA77_TRIUA
MLSALSGITQEVHVKQLRTFRLARPSSIDGLHRPLEPVQVLAVILYLQLRVSNNTANRKVSIWPSRSAGPCEVQFVLLFEVQFVDFLKFGLLIF